MKERILDGEPLSDREAQQPREQIDVGTKIGNLLLVLLALAVVSDLRQLLANLFLLFLAARWAGVFRPMLNRLKSFVWISVMIIAVHSLFNPGNRHFWNFFGLEGFTYGSRIALRLLCTVVAANILVLTTKPTALIRWFGRLNPDLGTIFGLVLSVVPVMRTQMSTTLEVQCARGLRQDRLLDRFFAYVAVIVPVIVKSIIRAHTMTKLLYLRGYDGKGINYRPQIKLRDWGALGIGISCLLVNLCISLNL